MKPIIRFSWIGLLLAPLVIPFVYSALVACANPGWNMIFAFLFFFICGCIFSYGTTIFLFLPCLHVSSRLVRPTIWFAGILGAVLTAPAYLPLAWLMYVTSGNDSGPPQGTFLESLRHQLADPIDLAFPIGGLITAVIYWVFAHRKAQSCEQAAV
ncbi:MAG TPA: hypothetical protein VMV72_16005 [Verrucomicrobiae bacterium]|nr:hypothetical protein [Verrucomicrobiae bacterium]